MAANETESNAPLVDGNETETRSSSTQSGTDVTDQKERHEKEKEQEQHVAGEKPEDKDKNSDPSGDKEKDPDAAAVVDPNIVDWDGPDDPANPRNWSMSRKMLNISLVSVSILYSYV